MGRAMRWFKELFGIKIKENDRYSGHISTTTPLKLTPAEAALLRSFYSGSDRDRNRHAIVVAAAMAATADAAVAAAQATAAVIRLTDHDSREKVAATKIQRVFRGHLARRALRALKALVKIQALVRGYLVRKQAAATLKGMQTLITVQASVRALANKSRRLIHNDHTFASKFQARKSLNEPFSIYLQEKFDGSPKIVEVDIGSRPKPRSRRSSSWISTPSDESFGNEFSYRILTRVPIPVTRDFHDQECLFSTSQSTQSLANSCLCNSPAKSVCVESFNSIYNDNPNYMAKTKSFKAKLKSCSARRQRREPVPDTKMSIHELMESRNSMRTQRSCSRAEEAVNFKNVVMGRFGRSNHLVRES